MDIIKQISGENNSINHVDADIKKISIRINGKNNHINIEKHAKIHNLSILINGDNNTINIGERCSIVGSVNMRGDGNCLVISSLTSFQNTNINIQEGTSVSIGVNSMFASGVQIRTTDSHSITDMDGNRINPAKNISIGDKCWIGLDALIMKGAFIPDETIVGARATVTGKFSESNIIIAGTPAKIIKTGVKWDRRLL